MVAPRSVEQIAKEVVEGLRGCFHDITIPELVFVEGVFANALRAYAAEQVAQARGDLFQILVNRASCDLAGLEDVPSDASFVAMLDQLNYQTRDEWIEQAWELSRTMGIHVAACTETKIGRDAEICPTCEFFAAIRRRGEWSQT